MLLFSYSVRAASIWLGSVAGVLLRGGLELQHGDVDRAEVPKRLLELRHAEIISVDAR
jgi:hypothetical protein